MMTWRWLCMQAEAAKRVEAARGAQEAAEARADALAQELSTRADPAQVEALRKQVRGMEPPPPPPYGTQA